MTIDNNDFLYFHVPCRIPLFLRFIESLIASSALLPSNENTLRYNCFLNTYKHVVVALFFNPAML